MDGIDIIIVVHELIDTICTKAMLALCHPSRNLDAFGAPLLQRASVPRAEPRSVNPLMIQSRNDHDSPSTLARWDWYGSEERITSTSGKD